MSTAASRRGSARSTGRVKKEESRSERHNLDVQGRVATRRGAQHRDGPNTGEPKCDAYLWIKIPGESDGKGNGGPRAGKFWPEMATELIKDIN